MNENPFKNKETTPVEIFIAGESYWKTYKELTLEALGDILGSDLTQDATKISKEHTDSYWQAEISGPDRFTIFAKEQDQVVGMGHAYIEGYGRWVLSDDYIKAKFRNLGLGKKIIASRLNEIEKREGEKVKVFVRNNNEVSLTNYQKLGFKIAGKKTVVIPPGNTVELLVLEIDLNDPEIKKNISKVINAG